VFDAAVMFLWDKYDRRQGLELSVFDFGVTFTLFLMFGMWIFFAFPGTLVALRYIKLDCMF
jgi:hypothetical protein